MNLDEGQTAKVRQWIDQGLKVAEVQSRLADELGVKLTYMEARLLLDDLKLKPHDLPAPPKAPPGVVLGPGQGDPRGGGSAGGPGAGPGGGGAQGLAPVPPGVNPFAGGEAQGQGQAPGQAGRLAVSVDEIARPNAMVSGKVTFRDGQPADWQIDSMGRLAVIPKQPGYKPSQADVVDFQMELESILVRLGY